MAINFIQLNKRADLGTSKDGRNPNTGNILKVFNKQFSRFCAVRTRTMNQTYQLTNFNMQDTVDLVFRHDPLIQSLLK
ncbi:phage head closure protein, partial [Oenococcus oeni]